MCMCAWKVRYPVASFARTASTKDAKMGRKITAKATTTVTTLLLQRSDVIIYQCRNRFALEKQVTCSC